MGLIVAIDPGNIQSGYAVVRYDDHDIVEVIEKGKVDNAEIFSVIDRYHDYDLAIEMIASYGMAVGREVFDTCVYIGRFLQYAQGKAKDIQYVYRKEEKILLCGSMKAKDSNITQALVDLYAPGEPNNGKGNKKCPGFFYGFSKDAWSAFAVAVVYYNKYIKGVEI